MHPSPSTPSPSSASSGFHFPNFRGRAAGVIKTLSRVMGGGAVESHATRSQEGIHQRGPSFSAEKVDQDSETLQWCKEALATLEEKITQLTLEKGFDKEFYVLDSETSKEEDTVIGSALKQSNRSKNRYSDVLPFDAFRVVLRGSHHSSSNGTDYINASHIINPSGLALPRFIATQGPLENTVSDFWDMTRQEACAAVISLTCPVEGHRVKCAHYFPLNEGDIEVYGHVRVVNRSTKATQPHIMERILEIHEEGCPVYVIPHYQYLEWPDHGVPSSTNCIRGLIRFLRNSPKSLGPFVVHCSAGIGRTGTYCTIDHTVRKLLCRDKTALDVWSTVRHFRELRMGMVQTKEQYRFCYFAIRDELQDIVSSGKLL